MKRFLCRHFPWTQAEKCETLGYCRAGCNVHMEKKMCSKTDEEVCTYAKEKEENENALMRFIAGKV